VSLRQILGGGLILLSPNPEVSGRSSGMDPRPSISPPLFKDRRTAHRMHVFSVRQSSGLEYPTSQLVSLVEVLDYMHVVRFDLHLEIIFQNPVLTTALVTPPHPPSPIDSFGARRFDSFLLVAEPCNQTLTP